MQKKKPTEGIKFDQSKPDYSLVPPDALNEAVKALTYGAEKYDRENWRKLADADNRYFAAAQRHLWAFKKGEQNDRESGIHHLGHALANVMFMFELDLQNLAD